MACTDLKIEYYAYGIWVCMNGHAYPLTMATGVLFTYNMTITTSIRLLHNACDMHMD